MKEDSTVRSDQRTFENIIKRISEREFSCKKNGQFKMIQILIHLIEPFPNLTKITLTDIQ